MQHSMAQFMCQGEAPERFRQAAAEPDHFLTRLKKTVGPLWIVIRMKCRDLQFEPGGEFIHRRFIVLPTWVCCPEVREQLMGRFYRLRCLILHTFVHKLPTR